MKKAMPPISLLNGIDEARMLYEVKGRGGGAAYV